jgi:hypothetical protein
MDTLMKKLWAFAQNTLKEMKSMKRVWDDEEPPMNDEKKEMATLLS